MTRGTPVEGELAAVAAARPGLLVEELVLSRFERANLITRGQAVALLACGVLVQVPIVFAALAAGAGPPEGAGLVMVEATAVSPEGRISPWDTGIWSDAHAEAFANRDELILSWR